jgi:serine protease Do
MPKLLRLPLMLCALLLAALLPSDPVAADPADIAASSRSVVRVVLVAQDDGKVYYVGHGSGFAVTSNLIVTNAHVVAPLQEDSTILIGVIPSQGSKSYGGKLVAVSQRNDLALIRLEEGRIPAVPLLGTPVEDGANVVAIGYPGTVDRAQGLSLDQLIEPMAPIKTLGNVSGGRSSQDFDTVLHTAPMAAGNSGGPLVDSCGRVVGVNSFGSLSSGNDAEFGFAVSNREVAQFLRDAKVNFSQTSSECLSAAQATQEERERATALRRAEAEERAAEAAAKERAYTDQLRLAEREIENTRENRIAIAALLLAMTVLAGAAGGVLIDKGKRNPGIAACGGAALCLLGAVLVFLTRPSLNDAEDIAAARIEEAEKDARKSAAPGAVAMQGKLICTIQADRSRITLSQTAPLAIDWAQGGCVNGRTQYGRTGDSWSRIFVPNEEDTVSINSFDPGNGEFRTERFLLGIDAMRQARTIRGRYKYGQCTDDSAVIAELEDMQKALRQALPVQPNERLVYQCVPDPTGSGDTPVS